VISAAEPTEDLDAITVGMVCVRNLQVTMCRAPKSAALPSGGSH
jgi:hypothetical protein